MANWMIWLTVALVITMGHFGHSDRLFGFQRTYVIDFDTLMKELGKPLVVPPPESGIKSFLGFGKPKNGQRVAELLAMTGGEGDEVIEGFSVESLLDLDKFDRSDCKKSKQPKLDETCIKFCSKEAAKLDVPPPPSDYVRLNLGKYCWDIVKGIDAKCTQWAREDVLAYYDHV